MDLACCVEALERRGNVLYQWNFVRNLKRRMRRKARLLPGRFDLRPLRAVRTVRAFDEAFTAPHHGFRDAGDYYYRASSLRVVGRIAVPALVISADDDPFVPAAQFRDPALAANPRVQVVITRGGGHCGFFAEPEGASTGSGRSGRRWRSPPATAHSSRGRNRASGAPPAPCGPA